MDKTPRNPHKVIPEQDRPTIRQAGRQWREMTEHALTLRPAVIGGETADGDYSVMREGRIIGRIRKTEAHVGGGTVWAWGITVPLPMAAWSHGSADSLEAAQKAFRAAWEQFYASLSPEQIARWHRTQDARKP